MTGFRLNHRSRIDTAQVLDFRFDGKAYSGYDGDSVASALLARGVRVFGRSFKYHRPRGLLAAGCEEPNALMTICSKSAKLARSQGQTPNIPATTIRLTQGLVLKSQNRWPGLGFDIMAANSLIERFLSAGFYYKTFMKPGKRGWELYEPLIRRMAGLGRVSKTADNRSYETINDFCDVLVIGAGAAGLSAAITAASSKARVILVEQDWRLGGYLNSFDPIGTIEEWYQNCSAKISGYNNLKVLLNTTAFGLYDGNTVGLVERLSDRPAGFDVVSEVLRIVRAKSIIFACGAIEQPLLFSGNDRPGVMLASAVKTYLNRFAVAPGKKGIVFTNNDTAYSSVLALNRCGIEVMVCDLRAKVSGDIKALLGKHDIELRERSAISYVWGRKRVEAVEVADFDQQHQKLGAVWGSVPCDFVASSAGLAPNIHLTCHLGAKPVYRSDLAMFVPGDLASGHYGAGVINGSIELDLAVEDGIRAGIAASTYCDLSPDHYATPPCRLPTLITSYNVSKARHVGKGPLGGKAFVDFQHDVSTDDLIMSYQEGYRSIEHLKRYTTVGMATDQGKTANINAMHLVANKVGASVAAIGTTTYRPPYTPVSIGVLAGRHVNRQTKPERLLPLHDWHLKNGAVMIETGLWLRPWFYRQNGKNAISASIKETGHVRKHGGITDVSCLGKIMVTGEDAGTFLERIYVNSLVKMATGRVKYVVMLREDGLVMDDGTVTKLAKDQYFVTTTTSGACEVLSHLEFYHQAVWPNLRVIITDVSDQWAAFAVAGRDVDMVLARVFGSIAGKIDDLVPMTGRMFDLGQIPLLILRVSFSGELAYEVYLPSGYALSVWQKLLGDGESLQPYGLEALSSLRIEKGYITGNEIDGRVSLEDLSLGGMARTDGRFIGAPLMARGVLGAAKRRQKMGFELIDRDQSLKNGAILFEPDDPIAGHGRGYITSCGYSTTLGKQIALGFVSGGKNRLGQEMLAVFPLKNEIVRVKVVDPVFIDKPGIKLKRQNVIADVQITEVSKFVAGDPLFGVEWPLTNGSGFSIKPNNYNLLFELAGYNLDNPGSAKQLSEVLSGQKTASRWQILKLPNKRLWAISTDTMERSLVTKRVIDSNLVASITDLSDYYIRLNISGVNVEELLLHHIAVDLSDDRVVNYERAFIAPIHQVPVVIQKVIDGFDLYIPTTFCQTIFGLLAETTLGTHPINRW